MTELLDLDALEDELKHRPYDLAWLRSHDLLWVLIAELREARAERDYLLTTEAADAMLRDALTRTEAAEARRDELIRQAARLLEEREAAEARIAAALALHLRACAEPHDVASLGAALDAMARALGKDDE